jgi:hypothetical protein
LAAPTVTLDETSSLSIVDPQPHSTPASPRKKKNVHKGLQSKRTTNPELQDPATIEGYRRRLEETNTAQFTRTFSVESNLFQEPSVTSLPVTRPVTPETPRMSQHPIDPEAQTIINAMIQDGIQKANEARHNSNKNIDLGQPEPFNGSPHKLDGFLQECKLHFTIKPEVFQTEDRKVGFILSYMKTGDAKRWKEQFLKSRDAAVDATHPYSLAPNRRFADFEIELRQSFSNPYKKENALQQLQRIRQGKDTVDQHNIAFQLLVDRTGLDVHLNGDVLMQYYANSLNHHIREKILTSETLPTNLQGWFQKAAAFDNAYQRLKGYQFGGGGGGSGSKEKHRKRERNFQYSGNERRDPDAMDVDAMSLEEKKKRIKNGACFTCGENGHYSAKCPKRKDNKDRKGKGEQKGKFFKAQGKKKYNIEELRTHIRGIIAENYDSDPQGLEEFLDNAEDEGF